MWLALSTQQPSAKKKIKRTSVVRVAYERQSKNETRVCRCSVKRGAPAQRSLRCVAYCNLDLCSLRARRKGSRVYTLSLEQCVRTGCSSFSLSLLAKQRRVFIATSGAHIRRPRYLLLLLFTSFLSVLPRTMCKHIAQVDFVVSFFFFFSFCLWASFTA